MNQSNDTTQQQETLVEAARKQLTKRQSTFDKWSEQDEANQEFKDFSLPIVLALVDEMRKKIKQSKSSDDAKGVISTYSGKALRMLY